MRFESIGLSAEIIKAIQELGFVEATPVQSESIPHLLESKDQDLLAFAQTGTGKTAAFGLPIIEQIKTSDKNTQAIILSPTRELCIQIAKDIEAYSKYVKNLNVVPVYGGASIDTQIRALNKGAQIVVGTPGRTLDLINRRRLKLQNVEWLVLDEADEMLNMGFKEDLDSILSETPESKQTLLFSATMPKEIARIANKYMHNAKEIKIGEQNAGAENVTHIYYTVKASDKYAALKRIADINPEIYGIVFCRTRKDTKDITEKLIEDGYNADALHGDLSQAQRDTVMQRFRVKSLQILVATDVAARGLDVDNLTHIINYSLPDDPEVYIHRSGRTGRAGKKGLSLTIAHSRELSKIKALEKMVKKPFQKELIAGGDEIVEKRLYNLIDKIKKTQVNEAQIEPFLDQIYETFQDFSKEELIKKFVWVEFMRFLNYYKGSKDINISVRDNGNSNRKNSERRSPERRNNTSNDDFTRFYINLGSKNNVNPAVLIGIINDNTKTRNIEIGKIDLMKRFAFFEVEKQHEREIIQGFKNAEFNGHKISVEKSNAKPVTRSNDFGYGKRRDRKKGSDRKFKSTPNKNKGRRRS